MDKEKQAAYFYYSKYYKNLKEIQMLLRSDDSIGFVLGDLDNIMTQHNISLTDVIYLLDKYAHLL